jgi:hypothetical protein
LQTFDIAKSHPAHQRGYRLALIAAVFKNKPTAWLKHRAALFNNKTKGTQTLLPAAQCKRGLEPKITFFQMDVLRGDIGRIRRNYIDFFRKRSAHRRR